MSRISARYRRRLLLAVAIALSTGFVFAGVTVADGAVDEAAELEELDGTGTETDPYVVTNAEELQAMNQDLEAHYVLGDDIDAAETEAWNNGQGFEPIGDDDQGDRGQTPFSGSFDGQGHTISGLTIDRTTEGAIAPFGSVTGIVENARFEDVSVFGGEIYVGGVVGSNRGKVRSVTVTGEVEGTNRRIGGLAGDHFEEGEVIARSTADVDVSGDQLVGGLVGSNHGRIVESSAASDVDGRSSVGGLVGFNHGTVHNSYVTGEVTGDGKRVGGLIGWFSGAVTNTYTATPVSGEAEPSGAVMGAEDDRSTASERATRELYYDRSKIALDATDKGTDSGTGLTSGELTGKAAKSNMDFEFGEEWALTDEYPVLHWQVEDVDLQVRQPSIGEGKTTGVNVVLTLFDGSTVTATDAADYDAETAVAEVADGTLEANSVGQTDLTATVAGQSDSVTIEVLEPPNIEFVDAALGTDAVVEGAVVEATATYANTGGPGTETAAVTVDDETVATRALEIDADGETTATIAWEATDSGPVVLDDEELGTLSVYEPGTVDLESIALPEEAAAGSEYEIGLELTNDADQPLTETVELRIDGDRVADETVTVEPGGSTETITASHAAQGTATHVVELHDDAETATMEFLEPAEFELSALGAPEAITAGETVSVTATVTNVGGGADEAEIALTIDGEPVATRTVTLDADESDSLEFETTVEDAGAIDLAVESPNDELETTLTAEADDGSPGLGALGAIVALVIALAVGHRTRRR